MKKLIADKANKIRDNIQKSGQDIYHINTPNDVNFWLSNDELEYLLSTALIGKSFNYAVKTRSKIINQAICAALGYPVPKSFKKTHPRFLCQNFDKYAQQRTNLQIWNEDVALTRRYCLVILDPNNVVKDVKILSGGTLEKFDTTHKLTTKYQANLKSELSNTDSLLLSKNDTPEIQSVFGTFKKNTSSSPADLPREHELLSISQLFNKLNPLIGKKFKITGKSRIDGDKLQAIVYKALGYSIYKENGQLPDLLNQLLEIKRQLSRTIDLGLFKPDDKEDLEMPAINGYTPTIKDIRYAIFYCSQKDDIMTINKIYLVTGKDFFSYFSLFKGMRKNQKIQLHLPTSLWKNNSK